MIDYEELVKRILERSYFNGAFDRQYAVNNDAFGPAAPAQISTEDMDKLLEVQRQVASSPKISESIRHEPVDNMPSPDDYRGGTSNEEYRRAYAYWVNKKLWAEKATKDSKDGEVTVDLTPLTAPSAKFKCGTCRATDLNEKDLALNPRDGQIYGCWHCGGKKLEKL